MTQYNTLKVTFFNSRLDELNLGIQNDTNLILNLLPNVIADFNDETNFPR